MAKAKATKKSKKVVEETTTPTPKSETPVRTSLLPHVVTKELLDLKDRVSLLEAQLEKLLGSK